MIPRTPRLFARLAASQPDQVAQGRRDSERTTSYQPRRANGSDAAHPTRPDESVPAEPARGRPAAGSQPVEGPLTPRPTGTGLRTTQENPADTEHRHDVHGGGRHPGAGADGQWENRLTGIDALLSPPGAAPVTQPIPVIFSSPAAAAVTQPIPVISRAPVREPLHLRLLKDPALRGAAALMFSVVVSGGLAFVFWSLTAHRQHASGLGAVTAEVSAIMFLASVGSLNLISVFARFLPEAGWSARRLILTGYGGAAAVGLLAAMIFFLTPMAARLIIGGGPGRVAFAVCVVLNSVFMIQDGGLVGFGRYNWVPVENVLVAVARLLMLPLTAMFMSERIGVLWSWALPMAIAVLAVNAVIIGPLAGGQRNQRPRLPTAGQMGRFVAIESVTTAVAAAVTAFLPALVTQRLGSTQGGYFYVPWMIATMVSLPLMSILISMVREAVARPEKADATVRRSLGIVLLVVVVAMAACLLLPNLVLAPLGSSFVSHGAALLRWIGLSVPAVAVNLTYWSTCLVRRRPWPVLAVNLATSSAIVGGVMSLGLGSDISRVGLIYCMAQWAVAVVVTLPTITALRVVRQRQESR